MNLTMFSIVVLLSNLGSAREVILNPSWGTFRSC